MGIGASVFLLAAGAIIAFGLHVKVGFLDLQVVGWVLMFCGLLGLVFTMSLLSRRRRTIVTSTPTAPVAPAYGEHRVVEDSRPEYPADRPM